MNWIQSIMHMLHHMLTTTNNIMYTIFNHNTPLINVNTLSQAIKLVQSLQSGLTNTSDRDQYTIERVKSARNTLDIYQADHDQHMRPIVA